MREKEFMEMAKQEILRQLPEDVRVLSGKLNACG